MTSTSGLEGQALTPDDRPSILQLRQRVFGPEQLQCASERWNWNFLDNPADAVMYYLDADAGERLAGQCSG
jgi:hypothetical protein